MNKQGQMPIKRGSVMFTVKYFVGGSWDTDHFQELNSQLTS